MIEAVNSVIANASLLRSSTGQGNTVSAGVNLQGPANVSEPVAQGPQAPFLSLYIAVDNNFDTAILQVRDSGTGDVEDQFPSESRLQQRAQEEASRQRSAELAGREVEQTLNTASADTAPETQAAEVSVPDAPQPSNTQAQIASAALSASAEAGSATPPANVSVLA